MERVVTTAGVQSVLRGHRAVPTAAFESRKPSTGPGWMRSCPRPCQMRAEPRFRPPFERAWCSSMARRPPSQATLCVLGMWSPLSCCLLHPWKPCQRCAESGHTLACRAHHQPHSMLDQAMASGHTAEEPGRVRAQQSAPGCGACGLCQPPQLLHAINCNHPCVTSAGHSADGGV